MKLKLLYVLSLALLCTGLSVYVPGWKTIKEKAYTIYYTSSDTDNVKEYQISINTGVQTVELFFDEHFKKHFDVYIHPGRPSLDSTWQTDWKEPTFKSECWMVASGVAHKLDMISPKIWDKVACEHTYSESVKTQQLITHELVHVLHGQLNASPDFSNVEGIDWFVEGLATYASGQCDSVRLSEVKRAISANQAPATLDKFWTGNLRYGLSGSMVMYIDKKYGRARLKALLPFNRKTELLQSLNISESELIESWSAYIIK